MAAPEAPICVFAPDLMVTVTVERAPDGSDDIHFHAGGQGFWVARMVVKLGEGATLCAAVGGETGHVVRTLVDRSGLRFVGVTVEAHSAAYLHDRRHGRRREIARSDLPPIGRHDLDELYGAVLAEAMAAEVLVLAGSASPGRIPAAFFRRLGADLAAAGVPVVADVHGPLLDAFLDGGPIAVLKVSDEDLMQDGRLDGLAPAEAERAVRELHERGCRGVLLSRADGPDLARIRDGWYRIRSPRLEEMDHRGAGDSMTAALAVAQVRGLGPEDTLRLARAAGAANVTRHGLGSSNVRLVAALTSMIEVEAVCG